MYCSSVSRFYRARASSDDFWGARGAGSDREKALTPRRAFFVSWFWSLCCLRANRFLMERGCDNFIIARRGPVYTKQKPAPHLYREP